MTENDKPVITQVENLLFFDTETTGKYNFKGKYSDADQPYICQLGAILTDKVGKTLCELNILFSPEGREDWIIEVEAQNIHGISKEVCVANGAEPHLALIMFYYMMDKADLIVGHNINFDLGMMRREAHCLGDEDYITKLNSIDTFCTMNSNTNVLKLPGRYGFKWPKLTETYKHYFGKDFVDAHDAMADIRATRDVYFAMQKAKEAK